MQFQREGVSIRSWNKENMRYCMNLLNWFEITYRRVINLSFRKIKSLTTWWVGHTRGRNYHINFFLIFCPFFFFNVFTAQDGSTSSDVRHSFPGGGHIVVGAHARSGDSDQHRRPSKFHLQHGRLRLAPLRHGKTISHTVTLDPKPLIL